jgi:hypothetical protein
MGVLVGGVPLTFVTLRVHTTHKKQKTQKINKECRTKWKKERNHMVEWLAVLTLSNVNNKYKEEIYLQLKVTHEVSF